MNVELSEVTCPITWIEQTLLKGRQGLMLSCLQLWDLSVLSAQRWLPGMRAMSKESEGEFRGHCFDNSQDFPPIPPPPQGKACSTRLLQAPGPAPALDQGRVRS